jgi:hypothetical protein
MNDLACSGLDSAILLSPHVEDEKCLQSLLRDIKEIIAFNFSHIRGQFSFSVGIIPAMSTSGNLNLRE